MDRRTLKKLRGVQHAERGYWDGGQVEAFVSLYDNKNPQKARSLGRVRPQTMDAAVAAGMFEHDGPHFAGYSDRAYEHWFRVE